MNTPSPDELPGILIVDDTPINLRLLSRMLSEYGYHTRPVLSGEQALAAAQTLPPDLILLDIRMPEMDGYQVCQRLKADERTRDIPILFISALSETEDKVKALAAGGVDYITKPFRLEEVVARVQTHLALRALQEDLRKEIALRDTLIADLDAYAHTVAHDLRTPVTSALGFAQLLETQDDQFSAEERQLFVSDLAQSLRKMNSIIDELLLLAEVRKAEIQIKPVEMARVVEDALAQVADSARQTGTQIKHPQTWPSALGYAPWIEEVWVNYLNNAITYGGSPPSIELGATLAAGNNVRFWVHDNGAGLTPEQQARLFTPFTRLDQAHATGRGLGLSIVHRIVTKLDGQVGVESQGAPGQGSTFYFTLPGVQPNDAAN